MVIEISSAEILHRVRDIAQDELAVTTPDDTLRYKIEPGTEREDKVKMFINESVEDLSSHIWRFLSTEDMEEDASMENAPSLIPDRYVFNLDVSERRAAGKAIILKEKFATVLMESTLMRYYLSLGQVQLSQNHGQASASELKKIQTLIYTKALP